jgi:hypothetical protein
MLHQLHRCGAGHFRPAATPRSSLCPNAQVARCALQVPCAALPSWPELTGPPRRPQHGQSTGGLNPAQVDRAQEVAAAVDEDEASRCGLDSRRDQYAGWPPQEALDSVHDAPCFNQAVS